MAGYSYQKPPKTATLERRKGVQAGRMAFPQEICEVDETACVLRLKRVGGPTCNARAADAKTPDWAVAKPPSAATMPSAPVRLAGEA
jgi:hypothetical protein